MIKDTDVRARVALEDKEVAAAVLKEIGLTISDLLRMAIKQTAKLKRLPFDSTLSAESYAAIQEVESGHAKKVSHRIELELPASKPNIAKI
jgi:DNA-damage-inducible protein J